MTTDEMVAMLLQDQWRESPNAFAPQGTRCFYKRFPTPTDCHCNGAKGGMQVECAVYPMFATTDTEGRSVAYELKLCGELADGMWIEIHGWALPHDLAEGLKTVPRMLSGWEAMAGTNRQE